MDHHVARQVVLRVEHLAALGARDHLLRRRRSPRAHPTARCLARRRHRAQLQLSVCVRLLLCARRLARRTLAQLLALVLV